MVTFCDWEKRKCFSRHCTFLMQTLSQSSTQVHGTWSWNRFCTVQVGIVTTRNTEVAWDIKCWTPNWYKHMNLEGLVLGNAAVSVPDDSWDEKTDRPPLQSAQLSIETGNTESLGTSPSCSQSQCYAELSGCSRYSWYERVVSIFSTTTTTTTKA